MLTITSGSGVGWPDPGNQAQCAVPLPEAPLSPPLAHCEGNLMLTPGPLLPRTCPVSPGRARVHCSTTCAHWSRVLLTCYHGPGHGATETCAQRWWPRRLGGPGGLVPVPNMVHWLHCYYGTVPNMVHWLHYYYRTPNMVQWCLLVFSGLCLHSNDDMM